jgi:cytochrome c biogenesis protein CcmG, thiol:disulfide interchange protein DsbE
MFGGTSNTVRWEVSVSSSRLTWLSAIPRTAILAAVTLAVAVAIAAVVLLSHPSRPSSSASAATADSLGFRRLNLPAPQFDLPLLQGKGQVGLSTLSGRPIVMNLWASYCDICRAESPAVAQVSRLAQGKVSFLGVDTLDERAAAIRFAEKHKLSFPMAYDPNGVVAGKYHVPGLPYTFFISTSGTKILGVNVGALSAKSLINILHRLYGISFASTPS